MSVDWSELSRLERWMKDLWPNHKPWPADSYETLRAELTEVEPDDMWEWLLAHQETHPAHPPNPSETIKGTRDMARRRMKERPTPPALPSGEVVGVEALNRYLARIGASSFAEAIQIERNRY